MEAFDAADGGSFCLLELAMFVESAADLFLASWSCASWSNFLRCSELARRRSVDVQSLLEERADSWRDWLRLR